MGECQPLTLPGNYRRVRGKWSLDNLMDPQHPGVWEQVSNFFNLSIYIYIYLLCRFSFQGPWERVNPWLSQGITVGFQGPFRFHWGSIEVPFTISGSIQVHSRFQGPFRFHLGSIQIHSGFQSSFRIYSGSQAPFRIHAASPLLYHLPIGWYENRFQTFSTYPYIYINIFIM